MQRANPTWRSGVSRDSTPRSPADADSNPSRVGATQVATARLNLAPIPTVARQVAEATQFAIGQATSVRRRRVLADRSLLRRDVTPYRRVQTIPAVRPYHSASLPIRQHA